MPIPGRLWAPAPVTERKLANHQNESGKVRIKMYALQLPLIRQQAR
jgi:hypothetical protein